MDEAKSFPIYGSAMLFSLFLVLKYIPKDWVNFFMNSALAQA